jgi:hypothetical protein
VNASTCHESGIALRLPQMLRIGHRQPRREAASPAPLRALLA